MSKESKKVNLREKVINEGHLDKKDVKGLVSTAMEMDDNGQATDQIAWRMLEHEIGMLASGIQFSKQNITILMKGAESQAGAYVPSDVNGRISFPKTGRTYTRFLNGAAEIFNERSDDPAYKAFLDKAAAVRANMIKKQIAPEMKIREDTKTRIIPYDGGIIRKSDIVPYLIEAIPLMEFYDHRFSKNPAEQQEALKVMRSYFRHEKPEKFNAGGLDNIALRLFEQDKECFHTGVTLTKGYSVTSTALLGHLDSSGIPYATPMEITHVFKGSTQHKTMAKFTTNLCDVIIDRCQNGRPELRQMMADDAMQNAADVKERFEKYKYK